MTIFLNGKEFKVKKHQGIGDLNVDIGRGEVKAHPNDYIVDLGEHKIILSAAELKMLTFRPSSPLTTPQQNLERQTNPVGLHAGDRNKFPPSNASQAPHPPSRGPLPKPASTVEEATAKQEAINKASELKK